MYERGYLGNYQTAKTYGAHNFHSRKEMITEMY